MFALPDEGQLDSYSGAVAKHLPGTPSQVLLSLTDPGWPGGRWGRPAAEWSYRSYQELMDFLRRMRPHVSAEDGFAGMVLERWTRMLARLQELVDAVGRPRLDEPLELDANTRRELKRLDAPVQKMRCQFVAASVRRKLLQEIPGIDVRAGLSNAAGFVQGSWTARGIDWDGSCRTGSSGWRSSPPKTPAADAQRKHGKRGTPWPGGMRTSSTSRPSGRSSPTLLREQPARADGEPLGFRRFDPDFAYRYVNVKGISVGQAIDLGVRYTRTAARPRPT